MFFFNFPSTVKIFFRNLSMSFILFFFLIPELINYFPLRLQHPILPVLDRPDNIF